MHKALSFVFDILQTFVLAAAIFVIVYLFLLQPNMIKGASMETNFFDGDYILTEKVMYRFREPKRGEVVVFQSPSRPDVDYIKRIIGLPGETISLTDGVIYINDVPLDEEYQPTSETSAGRFLSSGEEFTVPSGTFFVMGDNRTHSSDSREFGTVALEDIRGRAVLRYWPLNRFGNISTPTYAVAAE